MQNMHCVNAQNCIPRICIKQATPKWFPPPLEQSSSPFWFVQWQKNNWLAYHPNHYCCACYVCCWRLGKKWRVPSDILVCLFKYIVQAGLQSSYWSLLMTAKARWMFYPCFQSSLEKWLFLMTATGTVKKFILWER